MDDIVIDARNWQRVEDFYESLKFALKSPSWHGNNVNAFSDSIFGGDINEINLPFKIVIHNLNDIGDEVKDLIVDDINYLRETSHRHNESNRFVIDIL